MTSLQTKSVHGIDLRGALNDSAAIGILMQILNGYARGGVYLITPWQGGGGLQTGKTLTNGVGYFTAFILAVIVIHD